MNKRYLVLVLCLCGAACTGWHNEALTPQLMEREPHQLRVTRSDGSKVVIVDPELQGNTLIGTHNLQPLVIPMDSVRATATRGFSTGRTLGFVAVVTGLLVLTAAFIGSITSHD